MKLLLDTHIFIWTVDGDTRLSAKARDIFEDQAATAYVSVVTIWEIASKAALAGGRRSGISFNGYRAIDLVEQSGFALLGIEPHHAAAVGSLPHYHADPFDRLLVTQAMSEGLTLLTHDERLALYGDFVTLV